MSKLRESRIKKLSSLDAAWLAGFVDGEGYLGIVYHEIKPEWQNTKTGTMPWYSPRFQIAGTDQHVMEEIVKMIGGGTHSITDKKGDPKWKPYHVFVLTGLADIKDILTQIKPYMKLKNTQLNLLLEFVDSRIESSYHASPKKSTYNDRNIEIYNLLRELNARGKASLKRQNEIKSIIAAGEVSAEEME